VRFRFFFTLNCCLCVLLYGYLTERDVHLMYVGGLISFASTVIFLFTLDISG